MSDPRNEPIRELLVLAIAAVGLMATVGWMVFLYLDLVGLEPRDLSGLRASYEPSQIEEVQMTSKEAQHKGGPSRPRCEVCNGNLFGSGWRISNFVRSIAWTGISRSGSNSLA